MVMVAEARQCTATRRDGESCTGRALPSSADQRCFAHDAGRQAALKESRQAGGRGRATAARAAKHLPPHLADVQARLLDLFAKVDAGAVLPLGAVDAHVKIAARLLDYGKFAVEVGEQRALEARLQALEDLQAGR